MAKEKITSIAASEEKTGIVKSILCIDMNIIMYNCIKLYFNDIDPEKYSSGWNMLDAFKDIDSHLNFDLNAFYNIMDLIKKFNVSKMISKEVEIDGIREMETTVIPVSISFVDYQKDIINQLDLEDPGIMYRVYNLDFYHDMYTNYKKDKQKLKHFNKYNALNWVGYLDAKEKLFDYTWISAPNSPILELGNDYACKSIQHLSYYKIEDVMDTEGLWFDEIFISLSPNYVPYKFKYFYDILKKFYKE